MGRAFALLYLHHNMKELLRLKRLHEETASAFFRILPAAEGWHVWIPARSIKIFDIDFFMACKKASDYIEQYRTPVKSQVGKPYRLKRQRVYKRKSKEDGSDYTIKHRPLDIPEVDDLQVL